MAVNRESSGTESPTPSGERATAIELIATRITAASGAVASMLAARKLYPGEDGSPPAVPTRAERVRAMPATGTGRGASSLQARESPRA